MQSAEKVNSLSLALDDCLLEEFQCIPGYYPRCPTVVLEVRRGNSEEILAIIPDAQRSCWKLDYCRCLGLALDAQVSPWKLEAQ